VLAVCNFEIEFTYILAGWEGSAHDGAVYRDAYYNIGLVTPPGKYWLGDAGYPNSDTILVPYRGTRYYLKEQRLAGKRPENSKELFNLRHALLRNVIKRIFGVVKRKY
jgi:DDE superfamily endonuclease